MLENVLPTNVSGMPCDTIFFQGIGTAQTQALKYIGDRTITATNGQSMWCVGRNQLKPLNVLYHVHIGVEVEDVFLIDNSAYFSKLLPSYLLGSFISWQTNSYYGFQFSSPPLPANESVEFYAPNISRMNVGQTTDIATHKAKYQSWQARENKNKGLILWGVSRGTAATFCAFAEEHYPEVRLVVLEGAIDSVQNILTNHTNALVQKESLSQSITNAVSSGLSFFKQKALTDYDPNGPSPLKSVDSFPEQVPVVFITSKIDRVVHSSNTQHIANTLAAKGKNDVYLLTLEHSRHPSYMFDDKHDHDKYETFIHAIYKKYNLEHDSQLAQRGEQWIAESTLHTLEPSLVQMNI